MMRGKEGTSKSGGQSDRQAQDRGSIDRSGDRRFDVVNNGKAALTERRSETPIIDLNNAVVNTELLLAYCSTGHYVCHVIEVLHTLLLRRARSERPLLQSSIDLLFRIVAVEPRLYLWALPSRWEFAVNLFAQLR